MTSQYGKVDKTMKKFIFILLLFSFFGCKKDKLEGDKSVFVGKWKWVYTEKSERYNCDNPPVTTIVTPSTEGKNYSIEFKEKGCVTFYENGDKIKKYRVVFIKFDLLSTTSYAGYYEFGIDLNNSKKISNFYGYVKSDTLVDIGFFPYEDLNLGCVSFSSYFVKE